jgi:hypothetical protein
VTGSRIGAASSTTSSAVPQFLPPVPSPAAAAAPLILALEACLGHGGESLTRPAAPPFHRLLLVLYDVLRRGANDGDLCWSASLALSSTST